jgi:VIT1/CCC1 family predicted Fe2+/Mn2+ transporter
LILGISNVFADAIAMGAGEYLSSKAHRDYVLTEKRREQWEYKNYKEGEVKEMIVLFNQRGMGLADAEIVVKKMAEYEDFFIDLMVTEELGLSLPDEDEASLLKDAFAMFISFLLFGTFPLLPFFLGPFDILNLDSLIMAAFLCTGVSLFSLGAFKSTFR